MAASVAAIEREASRIEEDAKYSAKRHFNAAAFWSSVHYWLGIPTVVLAAISATAAAGHHEGTAGGLAVAAAALAGLNTFLNPHQRATTHSVSGNRYKALQNRSRLFRELNCEDADRTGTELETELVSLAGQRDHLNDQSPPTPRLAFWLARRGIEQGETDYAVDKPPTASAVGDKPRGR